MTPGKGAVWSLYQRKNSCKSWSRRANAAPALNPCAFTMQTYPGADFSGLDCQWWDMKNVRLDGCDFEGATIANGKFENCTFVGANFRNAGLQGADLRNADLTGIDLRGGNVYSAWLEGARLDGIIQDESTRYFRLRCPEKGAFIGYKKCYEDRVVMLLIPAEAKRVSATNNACRCVRPRC